MTWTAAALDELAAREHWGYHATTLAASEPTALAAMALLAHDRAEAASRALDWLGEVQKSDGSVGITATDPTPGWPTSLAVLAWCAAQQDPRTAKADDYQARIKRAVEWLLHIEGVKLAATPGMGHDSTLVGWPWVVGTHSWIEPTVAAVLALRATGHGDHVRVAEAMQLLTNRLLPGGGCNYGNTFVLGQQLRPHLEPTGLVMIALAGQSDPTGQIGGSVSYLMRNLGAETPSISLAYGLMGLAAQGAPRPASSAWLEAAYERTAHQGANGAGLAPYPVALLLLAALGADNPLIVLPDGKRLNR